MNARERHILEIDRIKTALIKTKSKHLKNDYTKYLKKLTKELKEYDDERGKNGESW